MNRLYTLHSAKNLQKQLDQLIQQFQKRKHNALSFYLYEDASNKAVLENDLKLLKTIDIYRKQIDLLISELGK